MIEVGLIFSMSNIGQRSNMEDSMWPEAHIIAQGNRLFVVADGVGGASKGEIASAILTRVISGHFINWGLKDIDSIKSAVSRSVLEMNEYVKNNSEAENMASTLAMVTVNERNVLVAWVGDSRVILVRTGNVVFETEDHSLVNHLVKIGEITKEEAKIHPRRNVIYKSVNHNYDVSDLDFQILDDICSNDWIILCTDGILENLDKAAIEDIFSNDKIDMDYLKNKFEKLCFNNTRDNYTLFCVQLLNRN